MKAVLSLVTLCGSLLVSTFSSAHAALIAQYSFGTTGQATTVESSPLFAPTTVASGLVASSVTDPANAVVLEVSNAATTPASAPFLRIGPAASTTSAALAVANNSYYQINLQAASGFTLDLDSLAFNVTRGGSGTRGYVVRSSLDNFTTNLATADLATTRPNWTPVSIDLSSFPIFTDATAVSFRVYSYSAGTGSSVDYDDIVFNGTVAAVPEPSLVLGSLGLVGLLWFRKREH